MLALLLILIALICFALAALSVAVQRVNLVAAGLFCWCLATSLGTVHL